jgi:uncharacterized protein (UPF0147 family)
VRGKTPENTYICIRKYQKIPKNIRKYLELSGNTCKLSGNTTKYQEIQDQKHEILGNIWYFYATLVDLGFFIDWVLNYFALFTGIHEISNRKYKKIQEREIPRNIRKYFELSGNTS